MSSDGSTWPVVLTHWGWVTHICVGNIGHHWFRLWLVAWFAPSYYLNQCWNIVNWTLRNKLQWNFNRNLNILIQGNASQNVVCKMAAILSRPQCVKMAPSHQQMPYLLKVKISHDSYPHICNKHIKGILPKGPYRPCVSMAGRALLAGYHRIML